MPNPSELAAARKVLADITVQGLSEYTGKPALPAPKYDYAVPQLVNPKLPVSHLDFKDPLQFWEILSAAMNENPPPADQISALLPMFQPLGLELGKQWDRSKVDPLVLKAMARAAKDIQPMMNTLPFGRLTNGWFIPPPTIGDPKTDYKIRAIVARVGLTANTPKEAVYLDGMLGCRRQPAHRCQALHDDIREDAALHQARFLGLEDVRCGELLPCPQSAQSLCHRERFQGPELQRGWIADHLPAVRQPGF